MNPSRHNLFNDSKYTRWYYEMVDRAKKRGLKKPKRNSIGFVYYERHHIIPKCLWPKNSIDRDDPVNLVLFTAEEHYIAHALLPRMCVDKNHRKRLNKALQRMGNRCGRAKLYAMEKLRVNREGHDDRSKSLISEANKRRKHSEETRSKISTSLSGKNHTLETKSTISKSLSGRTLSKVHIDRIAASVSISSSKAFEVCDENGTYYAGRNIRQFCVERGLNASQMCRMLNGYKSSYRGWTKPI